MAPSYQRFCDTLNRRQFLKRASIGLGVTSLGSSLSPLVASAEPGIHFPAKAKRVIFLFMAGAPSQLDLFDHKPKSAGASALPL